MCHMMVFERDVPVTPLAVEHLRLAAEVNNEGHGAAVQRPDGSVWWTHSMDFGTALRSFLIARGEYPDGAAVFHSRLATTGKVTLDEVHPIMVPFWDLHTGVFLNGTLDIAHAPWESDTRRFAEEFVVELNLDDPVHHDSIETMARRCNAKIAIMTDTTWSDEGLYIFNRDQWIVTPYGALASNLSHLGKGKGWDEREECVHAGPLGLCVFDRPEECTEGLALHRWRYNPDGSIEVKWNEAERRARVAA